MLTPMAYSGQLGGHFKLAAISALPLFNNLCLTLLHSDRPKLYEVLAVLSVIGLRKEYNYS